MPKETVFRIPGYDVHIGWKTGGEAKITVEPVDDIERSQVLSQHDLKNLSAVLRKVDKQIFETTVLDTLLDSSKMTAQVKNLGFLKTSLILQLVEVVPFPEPVATWEVAGSKHSASWIYLREKIAISSSTKQYNKEAQRLPDGTLPQVAVGNLNRWFTHDLITLDTRFNSFVEATLRMSLFGKVQTNPEYVSIDIDYYLPHKYKRNKEENIDQAISRVIEEFRNLNKKLPEFAYCSDATMKKLHMEGVFDHLYEIEGSDFIFSSHSSGVRFISVDGNPSQKHNSEDYSTIDCPDLISFVDWADKPLVLMEGPSFDFAAPENHTGKFSKGWKEDDPDYVALLMEEYSFMPAWTNVDKVMILDISER